MSSSSAPAERLPTILTMLEAAYGRPDWQATGEPLAELIQTILSQHTSDINSGRAFRSLREHFPDFAAVRDAPEPLVAGAIRSGGLAEIKARRIQRVLRALSRDGESPALPDLHAMPLDQARRILIDLPGVGPKTAACVLMFGLGLPAMPVDTHVHRVSRRLQLIPDRMSAAAAHDALESMTPPGDIYSLHVNVVRHGRQICRAPVPRCHACCLRSLCPYPDRHAVPAPLRKEGTG